MTWLAWFLIAFTMCGAAADADDQDVWFRDQQVRHLQHVVVEHLELREVAVEVEDDGAGVAVVINERIFGASVAARCCQRGLIPHEA